MEATELKAYARDLCGKGPARRLRKKGLIPAVLYGSKMQTRLLSVSAADLANLRKKEEKAFIKLIIDEEGKKTEKLSIVRELQVEPLSRQYIHADFYEIEMGHKMTFDIPFHFSGDPIGVEEGGELHLLKRELKASCLPSARPEFIAVDIGGLRIGDVLKIQDITPPEGVSFDEQGDTAVVSVSAVRAKVRVEGEAEATETAAAETE